MKYRFIQCVMVLFVMLMFPLCVSAEGITKSEEEEVTKSEEFALLFWFNNWELGDTLKEDREFEMDPFVAVGLMYSLNYRKVGFHARYFFPTKKKATYPYGGHYQGECNVQRADLEFALSLELYGPIRLYAGYKYMKEKMEFERSWEKEQRSFYSGPTLGIHFSNASMHAHGLLYSLSYTYSWLRQHMEKTVRGEFGPYTYEYRFSLKAETVECGLGYMFENRLYVMASYRQQVINLYNESYLDDMTGPLLRFGYYF